MDLREIIDNLRRRWYLPLSGLLLLGAMAAGFSYFQTPQYTSTTQLFISTTAGASTADAFAGSQFSQSRVTSYAQLIMSDDMARMVKSRLRLQTAVSKLDAEIKAEAVPDTVLLNVSVTDSSPIRAQRIATAIGEVFPNWIASIEQPSSNSTSPVRITVTEQAEVATTPSSPRTLMNIAAAMFIGLLLGAVAALARGRFDEDRPRSAMSEISPAPRY